MTFLRTQTKKQFRRSSTSEQMNKIHLIHKKEYYLASKNEMKYWHIQEGNVS